MAAHAGAADPGGEHLPLVQAQRPAPRCAAHRRHRAPAAHAARPDGHVPNAARVGSAAADATDAGAPTGGRRARRRAARHRAVVAGSLRRSRGGVPGRDRDHPSCGRLAPSAPARGRGSEADAGRPLASDGGVRPLNRPRCAQGRHAVESGRPQRRRCRHAPAGPVDQARPPHDVDGGPARRLPRLHR